MPSTKSSHNHNFILENLFVELRTKMNKGFLPWDKKLILFKGTHMSLNSFHSAVTELSEFQYGFQNYRGFGEIPLISFTKITITVTAGRGYRVHFKSEQFIQPTVLSSDLKSQCGSSLEKAETSTHSTLCFFPVCIARQGDEDN